MATIKEYGFEKKQILEDTQQFIDGAWSTLRRWLATKGVILFDGEDIKEVRNQLYDLAFEELQNRINSNRFFVLTVNDYLVTYRLVDVLDDCKAIIEAIKSKTFDVDEVVNEYKLFVKSEHMELILIKEQLRN